MVKSELITSMSLQLDDLPPRDIEFAVKAILDVMSEVLANGDRIEVRGFGSFGLRHRPPRNAHNPRTGEKVLTQAKYRPHFKPGKALRQRVNDSRDIPIKDVKEAVEAEG